MNLDVRGRDAPLAGGQRFSKWALQSSTQEVRRERFTFRIPGAV
jgi:hypothetical protein